MNNNIPYAFTQNRELSWFRFDRRVLEEASDTSVPLFERLKFLSIFCSNLDEFFMIRVGSLFDISAMGKSYVDNKSNMTADQQLAEIFAHVRDLYPLKDKISYELFTRLGSYHIKKLKYEDLDDEQQKFAKEYFYANIEPVISAQIVDPHHPFPFMANKSIFVIASLQQKDKDYMGIISIPQMVPSVVYLPGDGIQFIKTEQLLLSFSEKIFKKFTVKSKNCICVTRNADIRFEEKYFEMDEDIRSHMAALLHKRKRLQPVRLETTGILNDKMQKYLCQKLRISPRQIFTSYDDLSYDYIYDLLAKAPDGLKRQLSFPPLERKENLFEKIFPVAKSRDIFLFYPFDSMQNFLQLIKEAAYNSKVISIKITIYRLSKNSKLVEYLCAAAENGIDVTVIMELRARFDEYNNIDWSEKLEQAGCRILYGLEKYKVHSKICLITYRDKGSLKYITQIGTGNYNEKTSDLYTDFSLITPNNDIGSDAAKLFYNISTGCTDAEYPTLMVAPSNLKEKLTSLIRREAEKGPEGRIIIKINSLTDLDLIKELVKASQAGVKTDLIVRGICCLLPGVKGYTENIQVTSVVGRFLEHSRFYSFGKYNRQKMYIGSADLMTRNTEKRIELACPVYDQNIIEAINNITDVILNDNVKARSMQNDGTYISKNKNKIRIDSQRYFAQNYRWKNETKAPEKSGVFKNLLDNISASFANLKAKNN